MPIGYKLTVDAVAQMIDAYNKGEALNSLAARFNVRRGTVIYHLQKAGVELRGSKSGPRKPYPYQEVIQSIYAAKK